MPDPTVTPESPLSIPMTAVKSSQIEAVGYDAAARILAVRFKRGKVAPAATYHYLDVPQETARQFASSASLGTALGKLIYGKFNFVKLAAEPTSPTVEA